MASINNIMDLDNMISAFYQYAEVKFSEFMIKKNTEISEMEVVDGEMKPVFDIMESKSRKEFADYLLYHLYGEKGVRRKIINCGRSEEECPLVQLFYVPPARFPNDPIVRLCRTLVLDTKNMRIVSLGLPKSVTLDEFLKENGDNFTIEEFQEKTMLIYNPSLNKMSIKAKVHTQPHDIWSHQDQLQKAAESKGNEETSESSDDKIEDVAISTRRLIGANTYFNSERKTFHQMFVENNEKQGLDLSKMPFQDDICMVFNMEHSDNVIINKNPCNRNTLMAVYQLMSDVEATQKWDAFLEKRKANANEKIDFLTVKSIPLTKVVEDCQASGLNINIPQRFDVNVSELNITLESVTKAEFWSNIIEKMPSMPVQGLMLKGRNGMQVALTHPTYATLKRLKGNVAVYAHIDNPDNTKNMFKVFWRLTQESQEASKIFQKPINIIPNYLQNFDTPDGFFGQVFTSFETNFKQMVHHTQNVYYLAYVARKLDKENIPYHLKPICYALHGQFLSDKQSTSITKVANYYLSMPYNKIYWRLFYKWQ